MCVCIYGHTVGEASTVIIDIHDERPTPEEGGRGRRERKEGEEWEKNERRTREKGGGRWRGRRRGERRGKGGG